MSDSGFTRETVSERLLRTAADAWSAQGTAGGQADPLVRLIFGAVAMELERIGHAIHESDARVFERIARYLLPEVMVRAEPAHAVARFAPAAATLATRYEEFSFEQTIRRKENLNRPETRAYGFSVAGDVQFTGARIANRVAGSQISTVSGSGWRPVATLSVPVGPTAVFLGFEGTFDDDEVMHLYCDWPGNAARARCLAALPRITAHDAYGQPLPVGVGLPVWELKDQEGDQAITFALEHRVRGYYHDHFLRIRIGRRNEGLPEELRQVIAGPIGQEAERLRWLRLDFPTDIPPDLVQSAIILENCAPVINRRLERAIFRLQHEVNIKVLDTEGAFIGIEKAENNQGQVYVEVPSAERVDATPGSFTVRHGATARFDDRDASQLLRHAIDQVREESRAFSSMDATSTVTDLRAIEQAMSRIERRITDVTTGRERTYLAMRPFEDGDTAHLHYWTTDGEAAEGMPAGTVLRSKRQGLSANGTIQLVSGTVGARERRSSRELVQQYRAAVLGRGRIVTRRDIMEHCRVICGPRLSDVAVTDGVMLSPGPSQGLVRCLDVALTFETGSVSDAERAYFKERLQADLNGASALSLLLRVL